MTNKGSMPIKNLALYTDEDENLHGIKIVDYQGRYFPATKFFNSGKHYVRRIVLSNGMNICVTKNHPLMTLDINNNHVWTLAEQIKENDKLLIFVPDDIRFEENRSSEEDIEDARYYAHQFRKDGYLSDNAERFLTCACPDAQATFLYYILYEKYSRHKFLPFKKKNVKIHGWSGYSLCTLQTILLQGLGIYSEIDTKNNDLIISEYESMYNLWKALFYVNITSRLTKNIEQILPKLFAKIASKEQSGKNHIPKDGIEHIEGNKLAAKNYRYVTVSAVYENLIKKEVYSVRVDNPSSDHSFVANGFINHNTESKLTPMGYAMLQNLDKGTVEFVPNFDNTKTEPSVLSGLICNLLLNGCSGIAVGMACNLLPHNLNEVYDALIYYIDKTIAGEEIKESDIFNIIKGPDFPIGGTIIGTKGIRDYLRTGTGTVIVRSDYKIESKNGKESIVFTNIPYRTNKAEIVKSIYDLYSKGVLNEIKDLRDESSKDELVRIVIDLKKDANKDVLINKLYQKTRLQTNMSVNSTVLVDGKQPVVANLDNILTSFLAHSVDVTIKYIDYENNKVITRLNIVNGILKAINHIDTIIETIRNSENEFEDIKKKMNIFDNDDQIRAVLDISLKNISRLNNKKYQSEFNQLTTKHEEYNKLLSDQTSLLNYIKEEYKAIKKKFGDERRTKIIESEYKVVDDADLIDDEVLVINYTNNDIIKAVSESDYKVQKRNGRGTNQYLNESENDSVKNIIVTNNKDTLLFFTNYGKCHALKAYKINKSSKTSKGKHINNYLNLDAGEQVVSIINTDKDNIENDLVFVTKNGIVKRMSFELLPKTSVSVKVITLLEDDALVDVIEANDNSRIFIVTAKGKSLVMDINKLRPSGRISRGVKGMKIADGDNIVKIASANVDDTLSNLLTITENGYSKLTSQSAFMSKGRGGAGVRAHKITDTTGDIVSCKIVDKNEDLFVSTRNGQMIRLDLAVARSQGKTSLGVRVVKLNEDDRVVSIATLTNNSEEHEEENVLAEA